MRFGIVFSNLVIVAFAFAQTELYDGFPSDRYTHIWKSSPFIAAAETSAEAESIAQRYVITGYTNLSGEDVVFVFDRKALTRFTISSSDSANGVELLEMLERNDTMALKAKIRAAGQVAEIVIDANVGSLQDAAAGAQPQNPGSVEVTNRTTPVTEATPAAARPRVPKPPQRIQRNTIGS